MLKDVHLIEAANAADGIVASLDEEVRNLFRTNAASIGAIRKTCWVNPVHEAERAVQWLQVGALSDYDRQLW